MARADLSAMLSRLPENENDSPPTEAPIAATEPPAPAPAPALATPALEARTRPRGPRRPATPAPAASAATGAGYLSFERKEARLRADQYAQLTEQSRRLNRAKGTGGQRITENTLIRVAIDLLLERADMLSGATEAELRKSVSL